MLHGTTVLSLTAIAQVCTMPIAIHRNFGRTTQAPPELDLSYDPGWDLRRAAQQPYCMSANDAPFEYSFRLVCHGQ